MHAPATVCSPEVGLNSSPHRLLPLSRPLHAARHHADCCSCRRQLYPDLVAEWEIVGKLQSVPWQWVCSVELSLAGFLAPTACLYPVQSIAIYPLTWMFLLHPGSTQTSGLLRLYQDAFDEIERLVNQERAAASADWKASHPAPAANEKNPYEGRLNFSLGSGSLEGEGKVAAQACNLGRACAFLTEGKRWFSWLSAEGTLNETIVTELYERAKWRRVTLNGDRSFVIMFPYFAVAGAVHLPDIAFLFAGEDALGIRGRARFMYTRQVFLGGCDCCGCCLLRRCMLLLAVVRPASACCAQALFQACRRASRSQRAPQRGPSFLAQIGRPLSSHPCSSLSRLSSARRLRPRQRLSHASLYSPP